MALKPCRECKKKVSTEAVTCPNCGVPNPTQEKPKVKPWKADAEYRKSLTSSSTSSKKTTSNNDTSWEKFMDGKLDLKTAFWGYGFFGSIVVGVICGFLSEAVSSFFIIVYIITAVVLILGLWQCASNYKKQMAQKKESELWGVLTHIYCVVAALGLANFIKDFI
tara:strand:+ start:179 stop:673 length:495 start_codon:yes stop_codon:yes gene_type:complete